MFKNNNNLYVKYINDEEKIGQQTLPKGLYIILPIDTEEVATNVAEELSLEIDKKMDDGLPNTGFVRSINKNKCLNQRPQNICTNIFYKSGIK